MSDSKKILLVDDSASSRLMNKMMISQKTTFEVICAKDGAEALTLVASASPDLVLMDVMMPGIDGLKVCEQIRSGGHMRGVPVILLTFKTDQESEKLGFASGCTEYLKKPVDEEKLLETLNRYLK